MPRLNERERRELGGNSIALEKEKRRQLKLIVKQGITSVDQKDPNYVRLHYVRYADDFIVGLCGPKSLAKHVMKHVTQFPKEDLHLEVNIEKTGLTHIVSNRIRSLGPDISAGNPPNAPTIKSSARHRALVRRRLKYEAQHPRQKWDSEFIRIANQTVIIALKKAKAKLGSLDRAKQKLHRNTQAIVDQYINSLRELGVDR